MTVTAPAPVSPITDTLSDTLSITMTTHPSGTTSIELDAVNSGYAPSDDEKALAVVFGDSGVGSYLIFGVLLVSLGSVHLVIQRRSFHG